MKLLTKLSCLLFLLPGFAFAHTGVSEASGFMHGFHHPFSGLDHMLAMLAVGLWSVQLGNSMRWKLPAAFVVALVIGGGLGFSGLTVPYIEEGILVSVLVLGVLIACRYTLSATISMAVVGAFALFHGYAHGAEMPATIGALSYTFGFTIAAVLIISAGIIVSDYLKKVNLQSWVRIAGSVIAMGGVYLALV